MIINMIALEEQSNFEWPFTYLYGPGEKEACRSAQKVSEPEAAAFRHLEERAKDGRGNVQPEGENDPGEPPDG